ncbi:MAG TPA: hypothetical protein PLZ16_13760 [Gammaproteobacteria bacterium]|mgnify:CR=1 FL=1|nr:hypothetical protein [Gammaproteobacteria bacterium]
MERQQAEESFALPAYPRQSDALGRFRGTEAFYDAALGSVITMNPLCKLLLPALLILLGACTQEQQNRISRLGVTWLEGDYRVTYADGSHVKSWEVRDGKVTSEPDKGYYFFWVIVDGKKRYVQTPIARSYIEEIAPR